MALHDHRVAVLGHVGEAVGKRFYRARGSAKGAEMIKSLGLAQAFDFGGCGGLQLPISSALRFEVDLIFSLPRTGEKPAMSSGRREAVENRPEIRLGSMF